MTFWRFFSKAGNLLIFRWWVFNFKIFVLYYKIKKIYGSPLRAVSDTLHCKVLVRWKQCCQNKFKSLDIGLKMYRIFVKRTIKINFCRGKIPKVGNSGINKYLGPRPGKFLPVRELFEDFLLSWWRIYITVKKIYRYGEKFSPCTGALHCIAKYREMHKTANPVLFNF
jgi:hypothetical protein